MPLRRDETPKLLPADEEAALEALRAQRQIVARAKLQTAAQAVARKLGPMDIEKVATEAVSLAAKDRTNFGNAQESAVVAITLNVLFLSASLRTEDAAGKGSKGKGRGGGNKKNAPPKIGAKVERLPPPTCASATAAIAASGATLAKVSRFEHGQLALLEAFVSWILIEQNEPLLPDVSKLLDALRSVGVLGEEVFTEYWTDVVSSLEVAKGELITLQSQSEEAWKGHKEAVESMKVAEEEEKEAVQRAKWAEAEVMNARCGNQPSPDEVAREKAATSGMAKASALKLQRSKDKEGSHKRQVATLGLREAADRNLADKTRQLRPLEVMHKHARAFFEGIVSPPAADAVEEAALAP